uniref:Ribosomal silencing factor RsfS n=1 Tax=Araucaria cunninghamii TaxID=56994 RepID=A0A0D6R413_ARACU
MSRRGLLAWAVIRAVASSSTISLSSSSCSLHKFLELKSQKNYVTGRPGCIASMLGPPTSSFSCIKKFSSENLKDSAYLCPSEEACAGEREEDADEEEGSDESSRFSYMKMLTLEEVDKILRDVRALDVKTIYVHNQCEWTDYMIFATGKSDWHIRNIAQALVYKVKQKQKGADQLVLPAVEGHQGGKWLVVDTGSIIVHALDENARAYYDLESLWTKERTSKGSNQLQELENSLKKVRRKEINNKDGI